MLLLKKNDWLWHCENKGVDFTDISGHLYAKINPSTSKVQIKGEKVLIKLRKVDQYEWHILMGLPELTSCSKKKEDTKKEEEYEDEDLADALILPGEAPKVTSLC